MDCLADRVEVRGVGAREPISSPNEHAAPTSSRWARGPHLGFEFAGLELDDLAVRIAKVGELRFRGQIADRRSLAGKVLRIGSRVHQHEQKAGTVA